MAATRDDDSFPLLQRQDALVDELRDNIPKALKEWDAAAIHAARVATRRLKAGLDLMKPVLSGEQTRPFARVLRKLRRRLGPLRDLDVMIGHLQLLAGRNRTKRSAITWVLERLEKSRVEAREQSGKDAAPGRVLARLGTWWGVREEVAAAREAIDSLIAEQLHLQLDSFAERADRLVAAAQSPFHKSTPSLRYAEGSDRAPGKSEPSEDLRLGGKGESPGSETGSKPQGDSKQDAIPNDPHELRIAGKSLRYTLEMAEIEGHDLPKKIMKAFKQMQESLGLWHDYVVLSERVMQVSLEALLPHHNAPLQGQVLDLAKNLLQRSTKHLTEFADLWSSRGQELAGSIRERFPLSRPVAAPATSLIGAPVIAPQTDRNPPDSADNSTPEAPAADAASTVQA